MDIAKLLDFLKLWLIKHIGKMDKGYVPYVMALERQHGQYDRTGFAWAPFGVAY